MKVIAKSDRTVDIQGIDNHQMTNVHIGTVAGLVNTNKGPVILIMHQYALVGRGHSIHSPSHWKWYKHQVCDKSVKVGGKQRIKTVDGYLIPLCIHNGLPHLSMRPPTDKEFNSLSHVVMTEDSDWDPSVLDFSFEENDQQLIPPAGDINFNPKLIKQNGESSACPIIKVPKDYADAVRLDTINGNTKWQNTTKLELDQVVQVYKAFGNIGHKDHIEPPQGYKHIHLIYGVKHNGRFKARLVADGHNIAAGYV